MSEEPKNGGALDLRLQYVEGEQRKHETRIEGVEQRQRAEIGHIESLRADVRENTHKLADLRGVVAEMHALLLQLKASLFTPPPEEVTNGSTRATTAKTRRKAGV